MSVCHIGSHLSTLFALQRCSESWSSWRAQILHLEIPCHRQHPPETTPHSLNSLNNHDVLRSAHLFQTHLFFLKLGCCKADGQTDLTAILLNHRRDHLQGNTTGSDLPAPAHVKPPSDLTRRCHCWTGEGRVRCDLPGPDEALPAAP